VPLYHAGTTSSDLFTLNENKYHQANPLQQPMPMPYASNGAVRG